MIEYIMWVLGSLLKTSMSVVAPIGTVVPIWPITVGIMIALAIIGVNLTLKYNSARPS